MNYRILLAYLGGILIALIILFLPYLTFDNKVLQDDKSLRVLSYSSFLQKWGAGPEIAKLFFEETGIKIHWINAGNAGLLLERLKFKRDSDRPDIVIGFDQYSIYEAKRTFKWLEIDKGEMVTSKSLLPYEAESKDFIAYDWGPMSFVFRQGELKEPLNLEDLLSLDYKDKLILLDPRMSSPGLQFLFWIVHHLGEEEAFEYLEKLKSSIKIMAPSWSSGYSLFKLQKSAIIFSYYTSPYYHQIEENNFDYKAADLLIPLPIQVEYAAVPEFCYQCDAAKKFAQFLLKKKSQEILMQKNYMYPVLAEAIKDSPFKLPKNPQFYDPKKSVALIKKKKELIRRWKKIFY